MTDEWMEEIVRAPERVLMPFGKHKGEMLGDIPGHYLEWCLDNIELAPKLKKSMEATLKMGGRD